MLLWFDGDFDRAFLLAHNPLRDSPAIVAHFRAITQFGMSAICLLLVASVFASSHFPAFRPVRPVLLVGLFAAKSLALALPFLFVVPAASAAVRLAKIALIVVASLVCYSRIVLGAHSLSDVLAAAALALACIPVAVSAANGIYARGKVTPEKLNSVVNRLAVVLLALTFGLPFL